MKTKYNAILVILSFIFLSCNNEINNYSALYFKTKHPNAKIVFITMHSEFHILLKAIHLVNPEVFISKNDVDTFTFNSIIEALKNDKLFYSEEMLQVYK